MTSSVRLYQFSVRGLLLAVALIGGLLGIVLCWLHAGGCGRTSTHVSYLQFSPDGEHLLVQVASTRYRALSTCDAIESQTLETSLQDVNDSSRVMLDLRKPHDRGRGSLGFLRKGKEIAIGQEDGTVRYWNVLTNSWGSEEHLCRLDDTTGFLDSWFTASEDGTRVAQLRFGPADSHIPELEVREVVTGKTLSTTSWFLEAPLLIASFSADSQLVAVQNEGAILLIDTATAEVRRKWYGSNGHGDPLLLDLSCDGSHVLLLCLEGLYLSRANSEELTKVQVLQSRRFSSARFTHDGTMFVSVDNDGVRLFETASGKQLGEALTNRNSAHAVFSPDDKTLVTAEVNGDLVLWDVASRMLMARLPMKGRFRTPWTVPLMLSCLWLLACWKFLLVRRRVALVNNSCGNIDDTWGATGAPPVRPR